MILFRDISLLAFILIPFTFLSAQTSIDGSFEFQSDPAKKYSIYVPTSYDEATPNTLMLGLHPFNVNRWDAQSWRDTLIYFAEENNLLLLCPDGGVDGKVDDAIDTAFTTVLLDSMQHWYNVDENAIYAMGFSWGGKTCYTYGLNHINTFAGIMPIGAAINGTSEILDVQAAAENKLFYLVHGSADSPNSRYFPLLDLLEENNACVNSMLLDGVNHTIDFPNRNDILSEALLWLKSTNCVSQTSNPSEDVNTNVFPNPVQTGQTLSIEKGSWTSLYDQTGKEIMTNSDLSDKVIQLPANLAAGSYSLSILVDNQIVTKQIIITN